jgi:hypothetical protein
MKQCAQSFPFNSIGTLKFEIRISKFETNAFCKFKFAKIRTSYSEFMIFDHFRMVSDFEIRISDLTLL